jgi:hypothetical protein
MNIPREINQNLGCIDAKNNYSTLKNPLKRGLKNPTALNILFPVQSAVLLIILKPCTHFNLNNVAIV